MVLMGLLVRGRSKEVQEKGEGVEDMGRLMAEGEGVDIAGPDL